ncbi:unnamed protein product, partial [marine sediment metagenome]
MDDSYVSGEDAFDYPTSWGVYIVSGGAPKHGGFRFNSITIPQGATISNAHMEVYVTSTNDDDPKLDIYGND